MNSSMKRLCMLVTACGAFLGGVALAPTVAKAAHPPVKLKTFEEITEQVGAMQEPRIIGANGEVRAGAGNQGMPYSPKQTCGTSGCHVQTYDQISDHAFHSAMGRNEWVDIQKNADGSSAPLGQFANKPKPWTQGTAMYGKW